MPAVTFTDGSDSYTVTGTDTYTLDFRAGDDVLDVRGGTFTTAYMGDGNDRTSLRSGDALVYGEAGADRFDVYGMGEWDYGGAPEAHGGADNDLFYLRGGNGVSLFGDHGDDRFNFIAGGTGILLRGGAGNDDFFGSGQAIGGTIYGDSGNDFFVLFSNPAGGVILRGNTGNDIYRFHAGTSAVFVELADQGLDTVQVARGVDYTLPDHIERISVSGFSGSTTGPAQLEGNALGNIINAHNNVDTIWGNGGNDRLFGKGANDTLHGGLGNDYLDGGPGDDFLYGGDGNDTINGRAGFDWMEGGAGDDLYYVDGATFGDVAHEEAGEGTDTVRVALTVAGSDYFLPDNIENGVIATSIGLRLLGNSLDNNLTGGGGDDDLVGRAGNDVLRGGDGNDGLYTWEGDDVAYGGNGNDILFGLEGNDRLYGDAGTDELWGNDGDDRIRGGTGGDNMGGGSGHNIYVYESVGDSTPAAHDWIIPEAQFSPDSSDVLDLSAIDANTTVAGNQAFTLRSGGTSTGAAGDLWYAFNSTTGRLEVFGDVNGDGVADLMITLSNWSMVGADQVIL